MDFPKDKRPRITYTKDIIVYDNTALSVNSGSIPIDIADFEYISIYLNVNSTTDIHLQTETIRGWKSFAIQNFSDVGGGVIFLEFNHSPLAFSKIRIVNTAATTASVQVFLKT